ncbi:hypothetical protein KJ652_01175 [Patescibacteria group bacterium]|nr:hypothetical protein [Patescibacteria group bacterium]MBU1123182.1 hypothetical protein [Patescibacteria group bacterium]MBU1911730.1 hypothetical protein [Patescibacteria group bacterium]
MTPREIIAKAWVITKKERQIRKWGYVAAVAETLLNIKLLTYQIWLITSYLHGNPIGFLTMERTIMNNTPTWFFWSLMGFILVLILVEWLFPHLSKGAIIGLAAKSHKGEEVKGGLVLAIYNFFPMFALHEIFFLGRITVVITLCSLMFRYSPEIAPLTVGILLIFYAISMIIHFFCIFAEEAVVIKKVGIGVALRTSFKLVISYLGQVVFLMLLFFVIVLRVLLNVVMVLFVPALVLGIGFLLALVMPPVISYSISGILGLIVVGIASYFFAYLAVFKQTVWTLTYMELGKRKELDVIDLDDEVTTKNGDGNGDA